ncbi:MAG: plastocyanin/azurin family copper-binding protein [Myxococcota bacterium]
MRKIAAALLLLVISLPLSAAFAEDVSDDGSVVTVNLTGNNALQYNLTEIKVPAGRKVKLTLTHVGTGSADSMGHNFVLLKAGTDAIQFGLAAASARDTGFIPAAKKDDVIAHTKVVGGGESVTIEFDAPAAGTYEYLCSFTGHFGTMRGKLIVE